MTRDKWVVVRRRQGEPRVSPLWPGWSAWCELGGRGGIVTQIKSFDTHAEALAYADRRSRTIEVTLPRHTAEEIIPTQEDGEPAWEVDVADYHNGHSWILQYDGEVCHECGRDGISRIVVQDDQRPALALHLLAHYYRKAHP